MSAAELMPPRRGTSVSHGCKVHYSTERGAVSLCPDRDLEHLTGKDQVRIADERRVCSHDPAEHARAAIVLIGDGTQGLASTHAVLPIPDVAAHDP